MWLCLPQVRPRIAPRTTARGTCTAHTAMRVNFYRDTCKGNSNGNKRELSPSPIAISQGTKRANFHHYLTTVCSGTDANARPTKVRSGAVAGIRKRYDGPFGTQDTSSRDRQGAPEDLRVYQGRGTIVAHMFRALNHIAIIIAMKNEDYTRAQLDVPNRKLSDDNKCNRNIMTWRQLGCVRCML
jgi:hypothetical protein